MSVARVIREVLLSPVRWLQRETWSASDHLAEWVFTAVLLTLLDLFGWVARRVRPLGPGPTGDGSGVREQVLAWQPRRLEDFTGVRIDPRAAGGVRSGRWERSSRAGGLAAGAVVVGWWVATALCLIRGLHHTYMPYYFQSEIRLFGLTVGPSPWLSIGRLALILGAIVGVLGWPALVRRLAAGDLALAQRMLGPGTQELSEEVVRLSETRTQAVAAADAERRRIERDLHDGFQPQLVNLALDLGLARSRLAKDPEGVMELLDRAHADAKRASEDLRDLVRGIHPSVLDERGLDAAFSALAARSHVPLQIDVRLPRRPSREVEGVAYFVVAEAITNIRKHSGAHSATVTVAADDTSLWLLVQDDGHGGARAEPGGGLDGLATRLAAVDGTFKLTSPSGGPTWMEASIPCAW